MGGVRLVVHGGMTLGKTNLDEYNRKAGEALTPDEVESLDVTGRQKRQMLASSKVGNTSVLSVPPSRQRRRGL